MCTLRCIDVAVIQVPAREGEKTLISGDLTESGSRRREVGGAFGGSARPAQGRDKARVSLVPQTP